jgi:hypothetical protein
MSCLRFSSGFSVKGTNSRGGIQRKKRTSAQRMSAPVTKSGNESPDRLTMRAA